jgi:hypothetical protein
MKNENAEKEFWTLARRAWRRPEAELDTAAIMDAVRLAAAEDARAASHGIAALPNWLCLAAAALAILFAMGTMGRSAGVADRQVGTAWLSSITPQEVAADVLLTPAYASLSLRKGH